MSTTIASSITINVGGKDYDAVVSVDHTPSQAATHDDAQIDEDFYLYDLAYEKRKDCWVGVDDLLKFDDLLNDILEQLKAAS